jgi:hypothetical protein
MTAEDSITSIIATKATRNLAVVYAWHLNTTEGRHTLYANAVLFERLTCLQEQLQDMIENEGCTP